MAYQGGEELDYDIHFPPPGNEIEPVIVLLGWAGCQEKHLAKYSATYEQKCITLRYTAPTDDLFYKMHNLRVTAKKILEVILDLNIEENPIMFHVFSNGGGMLYRHISELLCSPSFSMINVVGCIFDSLPAETSVLVGARAMANSTGTNVVFTYVFMFFLMLMFSARYFFLWLLAKDTGLDYSDYMSSETVAWPSLYLYSKADAIVNYRYVQSAIAQRRRRGADISEVCWEDSAHVAHMPRHRQEYVSRCLRFLDECIETRASSAAQ